MEPVTSVRLDKWLWAVRIYKTRSIAAAACTGGKVHIQGQAVKPARTVHIGEVITAVTGEITRVVKVTGLLEQRVGAKVVVQYVEDLTPASEYEKQRERRILAPVALRPKGTGRPTKKERREIEDLWRESNKPE
jgi:ribosome-associated heat shock protein Hsp15